MNNPEQQEAHGERYRLAQAAKLIRLYREATGHEPRTLTELQTWEATSDHERPIEPDAQDFEQ